MVAYTHQLVGKQISKLDELHLRDNTLVIVLGDNGTGRGTPSRSKGRDVLGAKGASTVRGTHVPGIGNWPGHVASGKVCHGMIDVNDFLPTICEAAGVTVPTGLKIDGCINCVVGRAVPATRSMRVTTPTADRQPNLTLRTIRTVLPQMKCPI
jgi:arylsulfatase A